MTFQPKQAIHELYLDCQGELEAMLNARLNCQETASDICQEAFVRLCRAEDLSGVANLKAFLFRTATNLLTDHYRSQAVHSAHKVEWHDDYALGVEDHRCAETVAKAEQELVRLVEALSMLPPLDQRIFYLNRFKCLKQRDIAETLNISVRTVEESIKRSLIHCGKLLGKT